MARRREPQGDARRKYVGIRAGFSNTIFLDEVLDQMFRHHLQKEYRNEAETEATLKLTGYLETLKKAYRFTATREDMKRFFALSEKERWDRKAGMTKADAVARFFSGKGKKPIKNTIPSLFKAKPTTPYIPRPGSSKGKTETQQIGAVKVERALREFIKSLFTIGDNLKVVKPKVGTQRTFTFPIKK